MKHLASIMILLLLAGCLGPATLDTSTDKKLKASVKEIKEELDPIQETKLDEALAYFVLGGSQGFVRLIGRAFSGEDIDAKKEGMANLSKLDGLSGKEILARYNQALAENKAAAAERKLAKEKKANERLALEEKRLAEAQLVRKTVQKIRDSLKQKQFATAEKLAETLKETAEGRKHFDQVSELVQKNMEAERRAQAAMAYVDKVQITEFEAKRIDTYSEENVPAVRIGIKNTGDHSLDRVEATVFFKDDKDNVIFEKSYALISDSPYTWDSNNRAPLKPGHLSEMGPNKYLTIDSTLSEWKEGNASLKITELEFTP